MLRLKSLMLLTVFTLTTSGLVAYAQNGQKPGNAAAQGKRGAGKPGAQQQRRNPSQQGNRRPGMNGAALIAKFDTDGDRALNAAELNTMLAALRSGTRGPQNGDAGPGPKGRGPGRAGGEKGQRGQGDGAKSPKRPSTDAWCVTRTSSTPT